MKKSYSHPATQQDLWVLSQFADGYKGTFCELGAYDGRMHSNTLLLEHNGWRGLLVEAHEPFFLRCQENRPLAQCKHMAIGDGSVKHLLVGGQYTGLAETMPSAWLDEHKRRGNQMYEVETVPLRTLVGTVDYLSVDTEGGEYEILKKWFEQGGLAKVVTVEFRYETELLHRLERLGNDYGYHLDEIRGFDLCLKR